MSMDELEIKSFLDEKFEQFNQVNFIQDDPISIPHQFTQKEDIEIAAFFAATIAWGNRKSIINNANKLMKSMDNAPFQFIINSTDDDIETLNYFKHRTFNFDDLKFFIKSLKNIYQNHCGLEQAFLGKTAKESIENFREIFFGIDHPNRTQKHVSNPGKGSSAKRLNMFLRWMVRKDNVDFGIWKVLKSSQLYLPLDVHTGNVSRALKLLARKQNDWKAVEEITQKLRSFDAQDPIKYDFALFGLGAVEKF